MFGIYRYGADKLASAFTLIRTIISIEDSFNITMSSGGGNWLLLSQYWWVGIAFSGFLWILPGYLIIFDAPSILVTYSLIYGWFVAWILMPISINDDIKHIQGKSKWDPNYRFYLFASLVPVFAAAISVIYLYRRHTYLGTP